VTKHIPWTDISSLYEVRRTLHHYPHILADIGSSVITYRAKVKLHGMNAGVVIEPDGTVSAMSRTGVLERGTGLNGFGAWVKEREDDFTKFRSDCTRVFYGEWCGPGIQKKVAISSVKDKVFAVFAQRFVLNDGETSGDFFCEHRLLKPMLAHTGCEVIPWFNEGEEFVFDWKRSVEELQPVVDRINACVAEVEKCDPWVRDRYGIEGLGEGLVFYPKPGHSYSDFANLCFKAKGLAHKTVAHTKPAQLDPLVIESLDNFAEAFVTEARLEQAVRAVNDGELTFPTKTIGEFLHWFANDIKKESQAEIEASGLDLKQAVHACCNKARAWYLTFCKAGVK